MAVKITITKKEEEFLRDWLGRCTNCKELESIRDKIDSAHTKSTEKKSGYPVSVFVSAAKTRIPTLVVPDSQTSAWYTKMQNFFNVNGVTLEIVNSALDKATLLCEGRNVWVEQLIYSVPKLAAGMPVRLGEGSSTVAKTQKGWLNRLDEKEYSCNQCDGHCPPGQCYSRPA